MPASGSQINGMWGNFTCVSDVQSQLDGGTVKVWSYILILMYYDVTLHRVRYQESIRKSVFPVSFFSHFFCGTSMRSKQTKFENTWRCLLYLAANFQFLTQLSSTQQKLSESAECWIPIAHRPSQHGSTPPSYRVVSLLCPNCDAYSLCALWLTPVSSIQWGVSIFVNSWF